MEVITMSANLNTRGIDDPVNGGAGFVWNRLNFERKRVFEELLKGSPPFSRVQELATNKEVVSAATWHQELIQSRLRKIDDALMRLIAGTYGSCCKCGRWIQDTKLDFDPAAAFCIDCWERTQTKN